MGFYKAEGGRGRLICGELIMNMLNKGRCSRCIASKKEPKEIKKDTAFTIFPVWLKCVINENWCRNCAPHCKEPPMGISAGDYLRLDKGEK
jgi:hypothetical protein